MSATRSRVRTGIEIAVAVVVLAAVFAWSEGLLSERVGPDTNPPAAEASGTPSAQAPVRATDADGVATGSVSAQLREIPVVVESLGTVRPVRDARVAARVAGVVRRVTVEEGERVEAGEVLVEIDAGELAARSRAALRQAEAAEARLEQARRDLARTEALHAREAATDVELETARTAVRLAEASLAAARQAARGESTLASYTTIRAPVPGRVASRLVEPGDLASAGTPLLVLESEGLERLEVPLDERVAANVVLHQEVPVVVDALEVRLVGRVAEIEPTADPESRTVLVELDLPPHPGLRTGLFGRARFTVGRREAVVIPGSAVRRVGGLELVEVVREAPPTSEHVSRQTVTRHVRTGEALPDGTVEVLSGIREGERVSLPAPRAGARPEGR